MEIHNGVTVPPAFHIIAKPIGPLCNLDCTYCFYLEKEDLYPGQKDFRMSDDILESFIRQKIENHRVPQVSFAWQGGEPTLLGVDFFRRVVALQNKYANGKKIDNALQTNGILLNDEWCDFFSENNFLVGLSIDGPEEIHNKYRINKSGKPTFNKVMNGIEVLKKNNVEFNTLTAVQRDNSNKPSEVYRFLKEIGSRFLQFIPIVERVQQSLGVLENKLVSTIHPHQSQVSNWSVDPLSLGNFLCVIFDEWVREDVGDYFIQLFDVTLSAWLGMESSLCLFRETCGQAMAIEHNGDLYSCDHYVFPEYKLGNIMDDPLSSLIGSDFQSKFGQDKLDNLPQYCRDCQVRFACHGECPKHRFTETPDGEAGLNYLCAGYKRFFTHVDPYMKFMANELLNKRPAKNVMYWAKEKDKGFPSLNLGPNDLCPCGSGKKLKKCCAKLG
jgi:uncharacterized protein